MSNNKLISEDEIDEFTKNMTGHEKWWYTELVTKGEFKISKENISLIATHCH
jgi:hypothetical protein